MKTIVNGRIILPDANGNFVVRSDVAVNFDNKIVSIEQPTCFNANYLENVIDAQHNFVSAGFINIHIHGCIGADTMDDDPTAIATMRNFLPKTGVTSFLPTTMTMPINSIRRAVDNVRREISIDHGAKILGVNLEGPFISSKFKGAQDEKNIIRADFNQIADFADIIRIITIAPEELSSLEFIDQCRRHNIIVSIGHSNADYQTAIDAINHGASHVTHLFNAQTGLHHRRPGIVGAAFDSDVIVELICDNVHVHPAIQRIVSRIKPHDQIVLITDSLRACGLGDGVYDLGGQAVNVKGNLATLEDGTIAASVAPMNHVVRNFRDNTGWPIERVVECVTKNPAVELGLYDSIGSIAVGKSADLIIFDDDVNVKAAFVGGRSIEF